MPAIFFESQKPNVSTLCLLPVQNSSASKRRVSSGSNEYFFGIETNPKPTTLSSKYSSFVHSISSMSDDLSALMLPDLSRPPPEVSLKKSGNSCMRPAGTESAVSLPPFVPPASNILTTIIDLLPVPPLSHIESLDVAREFNSGQSQGDRQGRIIEDTKPQGYVLTPDMFKMAPCLRPESSPCADDLGNYAMHVSQMELVWHGEFDRLFAQYYPHAWYLVPTFYPPSDRWRVFKDSAKVRFSCQECGHGWTSMKGRVIFWFHLNYTTNSGYVMFKLYGQQCQKCKNGSYEHAMWYPEEVVKVIGNVYNRVGQIFYGFVRPPLRIDRRQGKPRNQHNAELCQACKEGLCKEEWSFS